MIQTSLKREAALNRVKGLKKEADLKRVIDSKLIPPECLRPAQ